MKAKDLREAAAHIFEPNGVLINPECTTKITLSTAADLAIKLNSAANFIDELTDFTIWMSGFTEAFGNDDYFQHMRDKLLKQGNGIRQPETLKDNDPMVVEKIPEKTHRNLLAWEEFTHGALRDLKMDYTNQQSENLALKIKLLIDNDQVE